MTYCMHLASIHQQLIRTCGTSQRYRKYLINYILPGEGIINADTIIEKFKVSTDFVRFCVLRFQVRIILYVIGIYELIPPIG